MKVSAPHRGGTSGRAAPSLRPTPYAAETANPAGRHLSFAEICPDNRSRLCLIRPLLSRTEAELNKWRDAFHEALGPNGKLIVSLVPELQLIIGEPAPLSDLPLQ